MPSTPFDDRRADLVADRGQEGRFRPGWRSRPPRGWASIAAVRARRSSSRRRPARRRGEFLLLVGKHDVVVLPAMDVAHIGHEMTDVGAAGEADQLVEGIVRDQQHDQERRGRGQRERIEGRRMGGADRHRRRDGGEQHESQQHALQLVVLRGQHVARHAPAGAGKERQAGKPPAPPDDLVVGRVGPREVTAQDVEAHGDREVGHERRHQLHQIDLAPVDGGDHRPQHE